MAEYAYRVIYEKIQEGGCQVIFPAIPEIITYGRTLEEAREMARDALLCHIQSLQNDGEEIPTDTFLGEKPVIEKMKIAVWNSIS